MSTTVAPTSPDRGLYDDEHEAFRDSFRAFLKAEVTPHYADWERAGIIPREVFRKAGEHGFLGMAVPEELGGAGVDDFRFNAIIAEEVARANAVGFAINLHNDVCIPYLLEYCTEEQKRRWLPGLVSGELMIAIAMTEPGTGSDLSGIQTTARLDGDHYVLNGSKTFISSGINADLVIVAARTGDPARPHDSLSLLIVERDTPGFERGRNLDKIGMHAQDTAELSFGDARIPATNLLGAEGAGFRYLVHNLAQERMAIAIAAVEAGAVALEWTLDYVRERKVFGKPVGRFQNTRFELADVATQVEVTRAFVDGCVERLCAGTLTPERAAMAKLAASEMQCEVVDHCLQLFGGYGYMTEYPIAQAFVDARIQRIYGGTSEIMREVIGKSLGV
jgi:alkylation response protein AidB-like acyl-CoA dehydrogenase